MPCEAKSKKGLSAPNGINRTAKARLGKIHKPAKGEQSKLDTTEYRGRRLKWKTVNGATANPAINDAAKVPIAAERRKITMPDFFSDQLMYLLIPAS